MDKSSSFLKKLVNNNKPTTTTKINNKVVPFNTSSTTTTNHIPITVPAKLTSAQKEAALPFLTQEPPKSKSSSKSKALCRFFKKLTKATPAKDCLNKSTSTSEKKNTQYKLTVIPIIKRKETVSPLKANATEIVWYDSKISSTTTATEEITPVVVNNTASEYAQRIWNEDKTVYYKLDHVVEWIGNGKETSISILQSYMSRFDFKDLKLERAFRNLCSKLHLKGETQRIDRILLRFSARYFECNPQCIFDTADVVYAIVYSLLLLSTDLHVAQGDYKKISQSKFIKNTMSAISAGSPPAAMRINTVQSFDLIPLQRIPTNTSDISTRSSTYARSLDSAMPRTFSSLTFGSKTWQSEIKNSLKQMYSSIRHSQITNPSSPPAFIHNNNNNNSNRVGAALRRSVGIKKKVAEDATSATSVQSVSSVMHYQAVASHLQNTELPTSYTSNVPYYKEGMIVRKHLLESKNQKAKHRDWKECFMVIECSQLRMYKLKSSSPDATCIIGGGTNAQLIDIINLKHTLANALTSGYSRQHQHAFTLQQSNGVVFVFQVESADQVNEWVSTCNYWDARESKEPLVGGISSMEYGWGRCLKTQQEAATTTTIFEWNSPASPTISSMLEESAQLEVLHKHVHELAAQLDAHRDMKPTMESHFFGSKSASRAMTNWENKSHYLLNEIIKYQNYCNSIEKSLALQASIVA